MYGTTGPNSGLTKNNSERIRMASEKSSKTMKKLHQDGILSGLCGENNPMYGKISWNSGKTKYTDDRIRKSGEKQSIFRKKYWNSLNNEERDRIIGNLSLAANKAKKDTKIEIIVKTTLEKMNVNFIKNHRQGRFIFDFYLTDYNFVIECQGDYWHGNPEYFHELNDVQIKNINRDKNKIKYLIDSDINYLFLWENEIHRNKEILNKIILEKLNEKVI